MTRCKHNKTGFGMCKDCMKWIKETEEKIKDKKIEEIIKKVLKPHIYKEYEKIYIRNNRAEGLIVALSQTLLKFQQEVREETLSKLKKIHEDNMKICEDYQYAYGDIINAIYNK